MLFAKLKQQFPNSREGEPLKNHCTFRVGGPADYFYELIDIEELPAIIVCAEENHLPYLVIGRGTNILFTDKGFRGLIIKNISKECTVHGEWVEAQSGVLLAHIIKLAVGNNLSGLEPLYGLPGSIGGAVFGNAGVPGVEIGDFIEEVTVFNVADGIRVLKKSDISFEYRHTSFKEKNDVILSVKLKLARSSKEKSHEQIKQINLIRLGKQPAGYSAGSFFKNHDPKNPAGYLIDKAGLKGTRIGGAFISEKHGNFFMNNGTARADDLLELAALAQQKVRAQFGINLEMEIRIVGEI